MGNRKVTLIGGGGVRTPLVIYGINESREHLGVDEMVLYDLDADRAQLMCKLGRALIDREGGNLRLRVASDLEDAISGASFVLTAIRVGGIQARAIDERISIENGYSGQETTGPGGVAMGLRTATVAIEYARLIEKLSLDAWMINFTNPAGLITQAVSHNSGVRVIGICDTPTELFHRIAHALGEVHADVHCDYIGLNHLGWVRRVLLRGEDVTDRILNSDEAFRSLYQAPLFDFALLRSLKPAQPATMAGRASDPAPPAQRALQDADLCILRNQPKREAQCPANELRVGNIGEVNHNEGSGSVDRVGQTPDGEMTDRKPLSIALGGLVVSIILPVIPVIPVAVAHRAGH